ncbi:ABC transporter substrate-binding protein [Streptomyces sp. NPDC001530]|uniref:ABC transporter substrate-binding protein n=1 Tax=Streptomyces sp. NPDC001530 TaxID=3364582 RepID=UPI0036B34A9D
MRRTFALGIATVLAVSGLAGCGGDNEDGPEAKQTKAGPVTIEWWGWAPGYDKAAAAWNAAHPDITVKFTQTESGAKGGYQKMLSAVKAGNAPCLAQVGAETLPSFLVEGAVEDITPYVKDSAAKFQPSALKSVTFGGKQVAVPVDSGPMGLFYRKDIFARHKISVPKTWEEFTAAAEKLHAASPGTYLTSFNPDDMYGFSGLAQQAGAKWFSTEGDAWKVAVDDEPTLKVAAYWQNLIDKKLVDVQAAWSDAWFKHFSDGKIASLVGPVWMTKVLEDSVKGTSGKWAVAPMPNWVAGQTATGNVGGSPNAVLKGCKNPKEAVEFSTWLSTDTSAFDGLVTNGGLFPTTVNGAALPSIGTGRPFYGDQPVFQVFAEAAKTTVPDFGWGPATPELNEAFNAAVGDAVKKQGTLTEAFATIQTKAVESLKGKGLTVNQ